MRIELLYSPLELLSRLGMWAVNRHRVRTLRQTVAHSLALEHIDSLELLQLLRPTQPRTIFDIGANVGTWTLLAKALYPEATVHAFEPLQVHCERFHARTSALFNVFLHNFALGATTEVLPLHVLSQSDASSLLQITGDGTRFYGLSNTASVPVSVYCLDDVIRERCLPQPNVLKLDVQGYEMSVLQGARSTLAHVNAILTEVSFAELYQGQCLFGELTHFLSGFGFIPLAFGARTNTGKPLLQADVLFVTNPIAQQLRS